MIGEFVPAQHPGLGTVLLIGWLPANEQAPVTAIVADTGGQLHTVGLHDLSIDWHYDESEGKWKPDFE